MPALLVNTPSVNFAGALLMPAQAANPSASATPATADLKRIIALLLVCNRRKDPAPWQTLCGAVYSEQRPRTAVNTLCLKLCISIEHFLVSALQVLRETRGIEERAGIAILLELAPQVAKSCRGRGKIQHQVLVFFERCCYQFPHAGVDQYAAGNAGGEGLPAAGHQWAPRPQRVAGGGV